MTVNVPHVSTYMLDGRGHSGEIEGQAERRKFVVGRAYQPLPGQ